MSEWLDLMLEEIARKKREADTAVEEQRRRAEKRQTDDAERDDQAQSK